MYAYKVTVKYKLILKPLVKMFNHVIKNTN